MNVEPTLCPLCGEGHLAEQTHSRDAALDGFAYVISDLLDSLCDHCGETITTPAQSRHNKRLIIAARDRAVAERNRRERLTAAHILRIRKSLGLTQVQAARVFGGGLNAFGKYENGDVAPSEGMERLLRLADSVPEAADWLLRRAGLPAPTRPGASCGREQDCVVVQRLLHHAGRIAVSVSAIDAATEITATRVATQEATRFIYNSAEAANDQAATRPLELVAS